MNTDRHDEPGDRKLDELLESYNQPPAAIDGLARERMWQRIQAARAGAIRSRHRRSPTPRPQWGKGKLWWPVTAAALLVLGLAIGRQLPDDAKLRGEEEPAEVTTGERWSQPTAEALFRLVAQQVLRRSETLLTEYRHAEAEPLAAPSATDWAGQLLVQTRLLIDSPAAKEPQLRQLLRDLELILAQIVQTTDESSPEDRAWIREGLARRSILLRLRNELAPAVNAPKGA
jgi:hypothetical protein